MPTLRACTAGMLLVMLVPGVFAAPRDAGVLEDRMQVTVDPGDDFYRYVNGRWLDRTAIPPDRSNYGTFTVIHERTQQQLRALIDCLPCIGDSEDADVEESRKISALYRSYMDLATIEARGIAPIRPLLERVLATENRAALPVLLADLQHLGVDLPVALSIFRDARRPAQVRALSESIRSRHAGAHLLPLRQGAFRRAARPPIAGMLPVCLRSLGSIRRSAGRMRS